MSKLIIEKFKEELPTDDKLLTFCKWSKDREYFFVTDKKVVYLKKNLFSKDVTEIPYRRIDSIKSNSGLFFTDIIIKTSKESIKVPATKKEAAEISKLINERIY